MHVTIRSAQSLLLSMGLLLGVMNFEVRGSSRNLETEESPQSAFGTQSLTLLQQSSTGLPDILVVPSLDFGEVERLTESLTLLHVSNTGSAELTVESLVSSRPEFRVDTAAPFGVAPGGSFPVEVVFTPSSAGQVVGALDIGSNDPDEPSVRVSLRGTGFGNPAIEISPPEVEFGCLRLGLNSASRPTIRNPSQDLLRIFGVTSDSPEFFPTGWPETLEGGQSATLTIIFTPAEGGTRRGKMTIESNDPDEPRLVIDVSGKGVVGNNPCADFAWDPTSVSIGEEVQFLNRSTSTDGDANRYSWDFNNDGLEDSDQINPSHTFDSAGPQKVLLTVMNSYGEQTVTKIVPVGRPDRPVVTSVERQFGDFFLEGVHEVIPDNRFDVEVEWNGAPGSVFVRLDNGPSMEIPSDSQGGSITFDMADFPTGLEPTEIDIWARNQAGLVGDPFTERLHVFPFPDWLRRVFNLQIGQLSFQADPEEGTVDHLLTLEFPQPRLGGFFLNIPSAVPLLGGRFGMDASYTRIDGRVSSIGEGFFGMRAFSGFQAMNGEVEGRGSGNGEFVMRPGEGLRLTSGSFNFAMRGTIRRSASLGDAIPALKKLEKKKVIGNLIKALNEGVTLVGELSPSLQMQMAFQERLGRLALDNAQGTLGLQMKATAQTQFLNLTASAWLAGGGSLTIGVPEPFLRELRLNAQIGAEITIDLLFGSLEPRATLDVNCTWRPTGGSQVRCGLGGSSSSGLNGPAEESLRLRTVRVPYHEYGAYSAFAPRELPFRRDSRLPSDLRQTVVVQNIFPGASPTLVETGDGKVLLWEHQDIADPVEQSTEIAFSVHDGQAWSAPALINDDRRVEIDPVAGVDDSGQVVAAWLRIKDSAFQGQIETFDDLPAFYSQMEVVSAVLDPSTGTWSTIVSLTDDQAFDHNLVLSSDGDGNLLLTWLSNPQAELLATPEAPAILFASRWSEGAWSSPAIVATGLVGVTGHAAAISGTEAFIALAVDPDSAVAGDEAIDLYQWNSSEWTGARFASGNGGNRLPAAAFDSDGRGHLVWAQGQNLVHTPLDDVDPRLIRSAGTSLGFQDVQLLAVAGGDLVLVWQEASNNAPSDLFSLIYEAQLDRWSEDRRLTMDETLSHSLSAFHAVDGSIEVAYLATEVLRSTETVIVEGTTTQIPNIPKNARTDIRTLEHTLIRDLAISRADLELSPVRPLPGQNTDLTLTVHNSGDFEVGPFAVEIHSGPSVQEGILVGRQVVGTLPAGAQAEFELRLEYPQSGGDIIVVIDADEAVAEFDEGNNTAIVRLTNSPPLPALVAGATRGSAPFEVSFSADQSVDPEDDALSFEWSFGDGSPVRTDASLTHTFVYPGEYVAVLTVTDEAGASVSDSVTIQVDPVVLFFSFFESFGDGFTGFAVANFSEEPANLEFRAFLPDGQLLSTPGNPSHIQLASGHQTAMLAREFFQLPESATAGWVELTTDNPQIGGFQQFGDQNRLDGAVASIRPTQALYFTRIFEGPDAFRGRPAQTRLSLANPSSLAARLEITLHPGDGSPSISIERAIPGRGFLVESPSSLFGQLPGPEAYIQIETIEGEGVTGVALVELPDQGTTIGLKGTSRSPAQVLYSAQLAHIDSTLFTNLKLVNVGNLPRTVQLEAISDRGGLLADPVVIEIQPGEAFQADAGALFSLPAGQPSVGSLRVNVDASGIVGDVLFGGEDLQSAAALPLQTEPFSRAIFNQVANIPGVIFTGLAFFNVGSQSAEVTVEVFTADGVRAGVTTLSLEPGRRIARTLAELVPESVGQVRGYVIVRSTQPLIAQELFGNFSQTLLSAVPPTVID